MVTFVWFLVYLVLSLNYSMVCVLLSETPEHEVIIDTMGGATILSCKALNISNIEHPWSDITEQSIKKTILDYKYMKEENAKFDIKVIDIRPEPEPYNKVKERESKQFNKNHNRLYKHN